MRVKYLFVGGVLVILGMILFLYGINLMESVKASLVVTIPLSSWEDQLMAYDDFRIPYQSGQIIALSGIVLLVIGVCLGIGGGLIPNKKITPKSSPISQGEVLNKSSPVSRDEALNILKKRYAKGEITKEQYEQMKKDLEEK